MSAAVLLMSCGSGSLRAEIAGRDLLAPASDNQERPAGEKEAASQWSTFSDMRILAAALSIADFASKSADRSVQPHKIKHINTLRAESPGMFDGFDLDNTYASAGTVTVLFNKEGKSFTIFIAEKAPGREVVTEKDSYVWARTDKYVVMARPDGVSAAEKTNLEDAKTLSDFLARRDPLPEKADLVIVFSNEYLETAFEAARLYAEGRAGTVIIAGGIGHSTEPLRVSASAYLGVEKSALDGLPEADIIAMVIKKELEVRLWSPEKIAGARILLEKESRNAQENVEKARDICLAQGIKADTVILIQRPDMEIRALRTFNTHFLKKFPASRGLSHAAFIPGPILLSDDKFVSLLVDEADKLIMYEKPVFGYLSPSPEGAALPADVKASYERLKRYLKSGLYVQANKATVGYRIDIGSGVRTSVEDAIQIETRSVPKGTSLTGFSWAKHKKTGRQYQGVVFLRSGKIKVVIKEAGNAVRELTLLPGDIISIFADSDVIFEEDSEFAAFRQTDELKNQALLSEVLKGETIADGKSRIEVDGKVLAEVYRGQAGDLQATIHRAAMGRPPKMVMITPQSAAMGVGLKVANGAEKFHRHDRDGQSRMEAMVCMGGKCAVVMADKEGRGPVPFTISSGQVLAALPWSSHGFTFDNADIAMVIQDPARGAKQTDKVEFEPAADPEALKKRTDKEVEDLISAIRIRAVAADREGKRIILGIETGLVPVGENAALQQKMDDSLLAAVRSLEGKLRAAGISNVSIITADNNTIAQAVTAEAGKTQTPLSDVVVLASIKSISTSAFDGLKTTETRLGALLAGVDASGLKIPSSATEVLDCQILEMLTAAMVLASGRQADYPFIDKKNSQPNNRIFIFLPKAEPIQYEKMEDLHKARLKALASA